MIAYSFLPVTDCNMCGAGPETQRLLGRRLNRSQGLLPRRVIGVSTTVMRCRNCGLVYPNPMPIPIDLDAHYGVPPESYWEHGYFTDGPGYFRQELDHLQTLMPVSAGMRALDVGAGIGKCMIALKGAGFDAFGIEPSAPFHQRAVSLGIAPEKLQLARVETADFPPDSFDFITFGATLEHMPDPSKAIGRALGWLKPGGLIHVEVPSSDWLIGRAANAYYRLTGSDYVANISPMHTPFHLYEFTLASFQRHAVRMGCRVVSHRRYVCQTFLPQPLSWVVSRLMAATGTGMQLSVWLGKP